MKNKTVVIYHRADFDGIFSREIAKRSLGDSAEYIGWDYGDPLSPIDAEIEVIYMIDISVDGMMEDRRVIWIDHHKSAMEKFGDSLRGYRIDGVAACRLAWQWFNNPYSPCNPHLHPCDYMLPAKEDFKMRVVSEPYAVRLAGEYDIWDKRDPNAELFQHGLRSRDLTEHWPDLLCITDSFRLSSQLLSAGEALQYARTKENESVIKAAGFTIDFEGLKFLAVNAARYNSNMFTAGLKPEHDGCFGFNWDGKMWRVSLYGVPGKPDVDLSLIAVKYGGGGHKQACGFKTTKLAFLS